LLKLVGTGIVAAVEVLASPHQEGGNIAEAVVGAEAQEGTDPAHSPVPGRPLALQGTEAGQDTENIQESFNKVPCDVLVILFLTFHSYSLCTHEKPSICFLRATTMCGKSSP